MYIKTYAKSVRKMLESIAKENEVYYNVITKMTFNVTERDIYKGGKYEREI